MPKRKTASESGERSGQLVARVSPETDRAVNAVCDARGYSRDRFIAALLETWSNAPESVRNALLGDVPSDLKAAVRAAWLRFFDVRFGPAEGAGMVKDAQSDQ